MNTYSDLWVMCYVIITMLSWVQHHYDYEVTSQKSDLPVGVERRQAVTTARQNQLKPAIDEDKIFRSVGEQ